MSASTPAYAPGARITGRADQEPAGLESTFLGAPINDLPKGLPKTLRSLCPECMKVIDARLFEEDGRVIMEKTCPEHGYVRDIYWSDADLSQGGEMGI